MTIEKAIIGNLLGLAVADSIGLPFEGLSSKRKVTLFGSELRQCLVLNYGIFSDDTEHSCMLVQSLISHFDDSDEFTKCFSKKLKWWLLGCPVGIGMSTLKSILKLWIGFSYQSSGVFSAGNGPAMRSSIIGVFFHNDDKKMHEFVKKSTIISHTDPKAEYGAMLIALASSVAVTKKGISPKDFYQYAKSNILDESNEIFDLLSLVNESLERNENTVQFAQSLGLQRGVSGYMYHTVPVVIHCWLRNQSDYKAGITEIIECGGDSDTTASILGGIIGARVGQEGIPKEWIENIIDRPRSIVWIKTLGIELSHVHRTKKAGNQIRVSVPILILRNIVFFIVVLAHGFRRLLPPY